MEEKWFPIHRSNICGFNPGLIKAVCSQMMVRHISGCSTGKRRAFFFKILKSKRYWNTFFFTENDYELKHKQERENTEFSTSTGFFFQ